MFGSIDLCTLGILICFYLRVELSRPVTFILKRVLYMSAVTFLVTVGAVIVNVQACLSPFTPYRVFSQCQPCPGAAMHTEMGFSFVCRFRPLDSRRRLRI